MSGGGQRAAGVTEGREAGQMIVNTHTFVVFLMRLLADGLIVYGILGMGDF